MHVEYCQNEPAAQEFIEEDDEAKEYFAVSTKPTKLCVYSRRAQLRPAPRSGAGWRSDGRENRCHPHYTPPL